MRLRLLLAILLLFGAPAARAETVLDLPAALRQAEVTSPRLREARSRAAEAAFRVDEAYVPAYPKMGLTAGYMHIDPGIEANLGPRPATIVAPDNYLVSLSLQQNLLTFGRLEWGTEAAELQRRSAEAELATAEQVIREQTEALYLEAYAAREGVRVAREALEASRLQLSDSESLVEQGVAAPFDVVRSRSEVLQSESQLLLARKREATSWVRLATHLGLPSAPVLELAAPPEAPAPPGSLTGTVERALGARPELQALRYAVEAAEARTGLAAAGDNPNLSLSTEYLRRNAVAFTRDYQWSAGVQLSVPIFDGGLTAARVGQAEEAARQVRARLDDVERSVRVEVEATFLDLGTAWEAVRVARQRLVELEEARRLANLRYQNGISTNLERLDAEAAWTGARFGLLQSELDYAAAWARWTRVAVLGGSEG